MHSPDLTIDSDKWLTDAIMLLERYKASYIAVVEHGEKAVLSGQMIFFIRIDLIKKEVPYYDEI